MKNKEATEPRDLTELVFSWSLEDIFNKELYKDQVKTIPETFQSVEDYFGSYVYPLLEETRAELCSSLEIISEAPFAEVISFDESKHEPTLYSINVDNWKNRFSGRGKEPYKTLPGDIFIVSNAKPETVSEFKRVGYKWTFASVTNITEDDENMGNNINSPTQFRVKAFGDIEVKDGMRNSLFVVFLMNITTNKRIWNALHMFRNLQIIKEVLNPDFEVERSCNICCGESNAFLAEQYRSSLSSNLNESQTDAVLACVCKMHCNHRPSIELIWGPPGTGKTRTVSMLLLTLLKSNCRILTCAPTNVAITELASRVQNLVKESFERDNQRSSSICSFGDILLFGHKDRLKVSSGIEDIYLDHRVERLMECVAPLTGWRHCFNSMTDFLENCASQYQVFLENEKIKDRESVSGNEGSKEECQSFLEFARKRFKWASKPLRRCLVIMYTHIPKRFLLESNFQLMVSLIDSLDSFQTLLFFENMDSEELEKLFSSDCCVHASPILSVRSNCVLFLKELQSSLAELKLPSSMNPSTLRVFCLQNASLFFCTASSSYKLHRIEMEPLHLLIVDEAAQLKECESAIPLQLPGISHAVLIGDECQLPAMVNSTISKDAGFGRSLFERLSLLAHPKNLLKVQYRMHPSISSFPNLNFYQNKIFDAPNVKTKSYRRNYLPGPMFGPYSFINVFGGKEEKDDVGYSWRNLVEASVAAKVVRNLYKAWNQSNGSKKLSIGVISPYAAQVVAIQDKLGKKYENIDGFSVKVKSIDGFQGGEEDIIIISTVRSNAGRELKFLSDPQRTNVSLTRARHCLWILGNEKTLAADTNSVWESLLRDAKYRQCFFNADEDEDLGKAILEAKKELDQLDDLLNPESILFKSSRWKVLFSDNFKKSFGKLTSLRIKKSVINLLLKLSSGWRPKGRNVDTVCDSSSQILKQFKVERLYVVCTVDIVKESKYVQVLKIWDILPLEDVPELVKRLDNIFSGYTEGFINCCKCKSLEGKFEVPTSWPPSSEIVRFKNLGTNGSASEPDGTTLDGRSYFENSKVSESLLLMKFYSLSSGVVNHLLSDRDGSELDLPFEVTDQELEIILFRKSTFILGRSGTGKTTVLTMKLFQKEQQHRMASEGFLKVNENRCPMTVHEESELVQEVEHSILRQVFVTVSSKLCFAIKQHVSNLKSFVCGGTFTAEKRSIDMDDIDDVQFQDIPDTFIDVQPNAYPLVITFHKFLMMLDGTLGNSYFERFHDARELSHGISSKSVALQTFIRRKEVSYDRFNSSYWPHFNSELTKKLDSTRVFTEIISHIKGGLQATDGKLDKMNYVQLSSGRVSTLSARERERIYDLFQDYEKLKIEKGEFDLADLVNDLHHRFRDGRYMGDEINYIYIDEVQDLTMRQIALFKYICKNVDDGFVFSGDTAQTIARGIDFRFQDIRTLFYKEFVLQSRSDSNDGRKEKGQISDIFHLSQNFRTHAGVLNLAQSVIELLYKFFPLHIDVLSPETSLIYGEAPVLLESGHDENAIVTIFGKSGNIGGEHVSFGAEQVILVRDESARNEISNYVGKQALVLTIVECKGLEFQDVLLYNFFSSSPLKNRWRVIYQYMKEQNLLDTASIRFPNFTPDKHNILCSELKQLYVAITRTRQRLWICENLEELSKPMFDYWKKLCVVQVRQLDDSLAQAMQVASSPDEWRSRGIKLFNEDNYQMATMCFERAGDIRRANWAKAAGLEAAAGRMSDSNPEMVDIILRQAAEIFDSVGVYERAAGCFCRLNEYERAGTIYLEKCGKTRLKQAGECFFRAGHYKHAAEIFARGNYFSDCLLVCMDAELFDMGLQFIQYWKENAKNDGLMVKKNKEIEKLEQDFLQKCAFHYHELKDNKSMMKFVRAFSSSDSMRSFLKNLHCLDELLTLEEEMGNFLEASNIAKQRGDILHSADLLGKAGQFREASNMILWYVCANSLWSNGSRGWPLKQFTPKEDLLSKAKLFAKNESDLFYEFVCTEASILLNKEGNLSEMKQNFFASRKHKSLRGEILSTWKILDAIIHSNTSKFEWDQDMISDVSKLEDRISCNRVSLKALIYFWDLWTEKILYIFEYLEHLETQDTNEYMSYGEFCLNYFAVRRQFTNLIPIYVLLNSDSEWVREIDDRLLRREDNLVSIDTRQFTSVTRNYWISEMLSVGMKVLQTLESLYKLSIKNSLPVFSQSICLIHIYEVAIFLKNCKFMKCCKHSKTKFLDGFLKMSTEQFIFNAFPLDWQNSLTEEMILLREDKRSVNLYLEVISGNISSKAKLTYGQIGRIVMIMLGSGKLPDEIYESVAEKCDDTLPWKTFIGNLSMKNSRVVPLGTFTDSIYDTYSINWRAENDYISPGCFLYFLERFLISISSCRGHFFSSKSSFVEWLIFQEWAFKPSSSSRTAKLEDLLRARGVVAQIVGQFLFFEAETKDWLRKLNIDCSGSYQKVVLRLVVILCLLCLDSVDYLNLLFRVLSRSDISSRLPLEFVGALRRVQNRNRFLVIPEAFKKIGNPLVLVRLKNNNAQAVCHDAIFIDMTCNPSKEDLLRLLFLKNVKAQNDQINSVKNDAVELSSNSNGKGKSPIISASKSADAMDKGMETQYETKQCDSEESFNHFWEVFDSLNSLTNNGGKNISSLMSNATKIKVDVEKNIELMNAAFSKCSSIASSDGENEILLKEMKIMLDELNELAVALDVRKNKHDQNITKIAEIVKSLESQRPSLEPFLKQFLSQNGEGAVNEVVAETGNASHEKEEDNSKAEKNKMAQTGNKKGNSKPRGGKRGGKGKRK